MSPRLNKAQKDKLDFFWHILDKVKVAGESEALPARVENGLIVSEDGSISAAEIVKIAPKRAAHVTIPSSDGGVFLNALQAANQQGGWLIVSLNDDVPAEVLTALTQLSDDNRFTVTDDTGNITSSSLNPDTRLIFFTTRSLIEERISYPYFYSLFGPVLSL